MANLVQSMKGNPARRIRTPVADIIVAVVDFGRVDR
jgi:hypothetical protein